MNKHARLPFLGLLKVSLLGVAFPLLLTNLNWAQANTKQDNNLLYAETIALVRLEDEDEDSVVREAATIALETLTKLNNPPENI